MTDTFAQDTTRPRRGRRESRPSGDDREQAILATAERLLGERDLSEISVDDLARGAGISRPTFYFYFASKEAVLLTLIDRVVAEADAASSAPPEGAPADPTAHWCTVIDAFLATFRAHRAVTLAAARVRGGNREVRELWAGVMETWVARAAHAIDCERERGAAPQGLPARDLAIALTSMTERVLHATFAAERPALAEARVVDTLLGIWLATVYQAPTPPRE
ncbi:TetR/AcrR family transcriptional regulator [Embleya scabrispora]|uniref:TetR/AcrR family transcriptional regulator n=1 Tax=Embleya scabrispora TaxID=159449 RepID=UPI00035C8D7C|nr:TetR/AcrR family transcriptional regulator [Embleya scabrispora]MYS84860.1 TetR family transcriptional regulator [Streptomyces sp. SID5474]